MCEPTRCYGFGWVQMFCFFDRWLFFLSLGYLSTDRFKFFHKFKQRCTQTFFWTAAVLILLFFFFLNLDGALLVLLHIFLTIKGRKPKSLTNICIFFKLQFGTQLSLFKFNVWVGVGGGGGGIWPGPLSRHCPPLVMMRGDLGDYMVDVEYCMVKAHSMMGGMFVLILHPSLSYRRSALIILCT